MQHETSGGMERGIIPALPLSPDDSVYLKDCFTSQASVSSYINIKRETKQYLICKTYSGMDNSMITQMFIKRSGTKF